MHRSITKKRMPASALLDTSVCLLGPWGLAAGGKMTPQVLAVTTLTKYFLFKFTVHSKLFFSGITMLSVTYSYTRLRYIKFGPILLKTDCSNLDLNKQSYLMNIKTLS